jgi:hypothetical protein
LVRVTARSPAIDRGGKGSGFYLFTPRLIPAVPFFVINLAMASRMRVRTFYWVSQLGMPPAPSSTLRRGAWRDRRTRGLAGLIGLLRSGACRQKVVDATRRAASTALAAAGVARRFSS